MPLLMAKKQKLVLHLANFFLTDQFHLHVYCRSGANSIRPLLLFFWRSASKRLSFHRKEHFGDRKEAEFVLKIMPQNGQSF